MQKFEGLAWDKSANFGTSQTVLVLKTLRSLLASMQRRFFFAARATPSMRQELGGLCWGYLLVMLAGNQKEATQFGGLDTNPDAVWTSPCCGTWFPLRWRPRRWPRHSAPEAAHCQGAPTLAMTRGTASSKLPPISPQNLPPTKGKSPCRGRKLTLQGPRKGGAFHRGNFWDACPLLLRAFEAATGTSAQAAMAPASGPPRCGTRALGPGDIPTNGQSWMKPDSSCCRCVKTSHKPSDYRDKPTHQQVRLVPARLLQLRGAATRQTKSCGPESIVPRWCGARWGSRTGKGRRPLAAQPRKLRVL